LGDCFKEQSEKLAETMEDVSTEQRVRETTIREMPPLG